MQFVAVLDLALYSLVRPIREVARFLRCSVTSLLPQLHGWLEVGKTGGKEPVVKKCCLPRHLGPSYTGPHATLCNQAMPFKPPLGQTKTPFRPVPTVIVQSRSNLFLLAAHCEMTQPFPSLQLCRFVQCPGWFCCLSFRLCPVCREKVKKAELRHLPQMSLAVHQCITIRSSCSTAFKGMHKLTIAIWWNKTFLTSWYFPVCSNTALKYWMSKKYNSAEMNEVWFFF